MSLTTDVIDPRARVLKLLNALGGTEEAVAASLRKLGVTGQRGEPCACPIFYYLRDAGVHVESVRTHVHMLTGESVLLPGPVGEFIAFFDSSPKAWPYLVEPEAVNR